MFHAVDMLRQHVTPDVRIHGIIRYAGEAPNIVPEENALEMYIRALERGNLNEVVRKIDDCARGAAIATQTTWEKEGDGRGLRQHEAESIWYRKSKAGL